jgi:outer membrane protein TolC
MEEAGSIAHSVVLGVEYRLAEAERELSGEQHRLHMAKRQLSSTLNVDYETLIADRLFVDRLLLPLDYYVDNAINLNSILCEANLSIELAKEGVRVAKSGLLPEVAVMGLASIYSPNLSDVIPKWAIGIEARIPIFDGLSKENSLQASKAEMGSVMMMVDKARNDIRLLVENEYYNVINALEDITTAESSMRLAESYYVSAEDGFKAGVTSSTELMDAEVERSASKLSYINAVYNYCISLARLLEASGLSHTLVDYRDNGVQIDIK